MKKYYIFELSEPGEIIKYGFAEESEPWLTNEIKESATAVIKLDDPRAGNNEISYIVKNGDIFEWGYIQNGNEEKENEK